MVYVSFYLVATIQLNTLYIIKYDLILNIRNIFHKQPVLLYVYRLITEKFNTVCLKKEQQMYL